MTDREIHSIDELREFAGEFLKNHPEGCRVGLSGELGAGKTTFVRQCVALIAEKNGKDVPRVTSPSFVLHQSYRLLAPPIEHFDLYRLDSVDEKGLIELGYYDALNRSGENKGFLFVEWPEHANPSDLLQLEVAIDIRLKPHSRVVSLTPQ